MTSTLSAGKFRHLTSMAQAGGIFKMIAVDQRPPLQAALARHGRRDPSDVRYEELQAVKVLLTKELAHAGSAILVDPVWAHAGALPVVPGHVGLLSTLEDHRFSLRQGERYSSLIPDWSVAQIKRSGADGVKLLVWHRPDVSAENQEHQDALVREVGADCRRHDVPFVLELLIYPLGGQSVDSPAYAAAKPQLVIDSVAHYSNDEFGVDLLKLEFPADLKYTREFAAGAFDGVPREAVYQLADVEARLREMSERTNVPWVLLSAGVGAREFALNMELAAAAGAAGFLAGRAVWSAALPHYPDLDAMARSLRSVSVPYLAQLGALADGGRPWNQHPRYAGSAPFQAQGESWHRAYGKD